MTRIRQVKIMEESIETEKCWKTIYRFRYTDTRVADLKWNRKERFAMVRTFFINTLKTDIFI